MGFDSYSPKFTRFVIPDSINDQLKFISSLKFGLKFLSTKISSVSPFRTPISTHQNILVPKFQTPISVCQNLPVPWFGPRLKSTKIYLFWGFWLRMYNPCAWFRLLKYNFETDTRVTDYSLYFILVPVFRSYSIIDREKIRLFLDKKFGAEVDLHLHVNQCEQTCVE